MFIGCQSTRRWLHPVSKLCNSILSRKFGSAHVLLCVLLLLLLQVAAFSSMGSCLSSYTLDWNVPSGYTVQCGSVNPSGWKVSNAKCRFNTPLFNVGVSADGAPQEVDFVIRVNQSGNLDADDSTKVLILVNGLVYSTYLFTGDNSNSVFSVLTSVFVPDNGTYQVQIICSTNNSNEFWTVKSGDLTICLRAPAPLPVELIDFNAAKVEENNVLLQWSTSSEYGNDYFLIEKSVDGNLFSWLGTAMGAGTVSSVSEYEMNDFETASSPVYYRLSQVDHNGEIKILSTILFIPHDKQNDAVNMWIQSEDNSLSIQINVDSFSGMSSLIEIHSSVGSLMYRKRLWLDPGLNKVEFETPTSGGSGLLYFILTTVSGTRLTVRYPAFN